MKSALIMLGFIVLYSRLFCHEDWTPEFFVILKPAGRIFQNWGPRPRAGPGPGPSFSREISRGISREITSREIHRELLIQETTFLRMRSSRPLADIQEPQAVSSRNGVRRCADRDYPNSTPRRSESPTQSPGFGPQSPRSRKLSRFDGAWRFIISRNSLKILAGGLVNLGAQFLAPCESWGLANLANL